MSSLVLIAGFEPARMGSKSIMFAITSYQQAEEVGIEPTCPCITWAAYV